MAELRAVLFDLDGVLTDTAHYHFQSWQVIAEELGITHDEEQNEKLKGVDRLASLMIILGDRAGEFSEVQIQDMMRRKNEIYVEKIKQMSPADRYEGCVELLTALRDAGIFVAVGSSSKNARPVIDYIQIGNLLDAVVDGTELENGKPDPEVFLKAAAKLGVSPEDCVVVEDAEAGVEAALRGGMKAVGFGHPGSLQKAHLLVNSLKQLSVEKFRELFR